MTRGFEAELGAAQAWLLDVRRELGAASQEEARAALCATLHALRDALGAHQSALFAGRLPLLVRGLFYEGWRPAWEPLGLVGEREFLAAIAAHHPGVVDARRAARAVFKAMEDRVRSGELEDLRRFLPASALGLWPRRLRGPLAPGETTVEQVMTRSVLYCAEEDPLDEVLARMDERRVRHVLVVDRAATSDDGGRVPEAAIRGILSNRDLLHLLREGPREGVRLDRLRVGDAMTPCPLHTTEPEVPAAAAARALLAHRVSALPVHDGDGLLLGLVTSEDLLAAAYARELAPA
ncbi:MAG: DUF2267 domain-containing protein [Planctomycetota bacterium]